MPEILDTMLSIAPLTPDAVITAAKAPPAPVMRNTRPADCRALLADSSVFLSPRNLIEITVAAITPQSMDIVFVPRNSITAGTSPVAASITVLRRMSTTGRKIGISDTPNDGSFSGRDISSTFSPFPFSSFSVLQPIRSMIFLTIDFYAILQ